MLPVTTTSQKARERGYLHVRQPYCETIALIRAADTIISKCRCLRLQQKLDRNFTTTCTWSTTGSYAFLLISTATMTGFSLEVNRPPPARKLCTVIIVVGRTVQTCVLDMPLGMQRHLGLNIPVHGVSARTFWLEAVMGSRCNELVLIPSRVTKTLLMIIVSSPSL